MNNKILLGSMLVFTMLLLMPSIPAIQQNIVKDEIISEMPNDLDLKDIRELLESGKLDSIKHPILYNLIRIWLLFRLWRASILLDISSDSVGPGLTELEVYYPIIFIISIWKIVAVVILSSFINYIPYQLGWNWHLPYK